MAEWTAQNLQTRARYKELYLRTSHFYTCAQSSGFPQVISTSCQETRHLEKTADTHRVIERVIKGGHWKVREPTKFQRMGSQGQDLQLEDRLLQERYNEQYTGDGSVDIKGMPSLKRKTGNWRASIFILCGVGNECIGYSGISINLVSYLTSKLHEGNAYAARIVTTWTGTFFLMSLVGAFIADAYWGRYWTIAVMSAINFIGMCTLALSALVPSFKPGEGVGLTCPSATPTQYALFFLGLYLMGIGGGSAVPCVSSFGADQFDVTDPRERIEKGSFFNWYYFSIQLGSIVSRSLIVWIQENAGWGLGFGIPTIFTAMAASTFFLGTPVYRFQRPSGSPLTRMFHVIVASLRKSKLEVPLDCSLLYETPGEDSAIEGSRKLQHTNGLKFLDKAAILSDAETTSGDLSDTWRLCTVTQVEELKILIRMLPIFATTIVYSAVYAQMSSLFILQGKVMDSKIGSFTIPAASLSVLDVASSVFCILFYDRVLVPITRKFTGKERGFSELQRIGIGLFISALSMISAALLEFRRLQLARELGLFNENTRAPISILWQVPQYFLIGAADAFASAGRFEFFYNEAPDGMRSLCSALAVVVLSAGNYLSSLILTIVTSITTAGGNPGWIPDNLNDGHLDYFFWLLSGLSFLNLLIFAFCAIDYKPKLTS